MLLDCVDSILRNDFRDFEIIIIDQDRQPTLDTELARRFPGDSRLVRLVLDEAHASRARNLGIRHARGDILVFSDDDVEVDPGWLRAYVDAFAACGNQPIIVGGRLEPLWLAPRPSWLPASKEYLLGIYDRPGGFGPMPEPDQPIGANFATHRKVLDTVGGFDERLGPSYARKRLIYGEEALLTMRARHAGHAVYYQSAARSRHKMTAARLRKRAFIRRSFWEGVTSLTVLHLIGSIPADRWRDLALWHVHDFSRAGRRLAATLARWRGLANPSQRAMEAVSSMAYSAGVIRAALVLGRTRQLPW